MESVERHRRILAALRQRQRVDIPDLAEQLGCSEMTVRRDLDTLAELGAARRVRGGAVSLLTGAETPFAARLHLGGTGKRAIAGVVANLITDGETVILDGGTTPMEVAKLLVGRDLTVLPLALPAAVALGGGVRPRLLLPGGEVRPGELTMTGPLAEHAFTRLRFDTMVLGCCGVDLAHGVTAFDLADASVKRAAIAASRRVIAVADASKLGKVAFGTVCPIARLDLLVTDRSGDEEQVRAFREAGVGVVVAAGSDGDGSDGDGSGGDSDE